jgi:hypothetical protein
MEGTGIDSLLHKDETTNCTVIIQKGIDKQIIKDCDIYVNKEQSDIITILIKDKFSGTEVQLTIEKVI